MPKSLLEANNAAREIDRLLSPGEAQKSHESSLALRDESKPSVASEPALQKNSVDEVPR